ncbi:hypothetical protein ACFXMT_22925 [Streptomyces mirabilis]|uniref:hypothetical protein n=1 Tax=Streptomyces mirabilis TaxID=68239 RepID=UPI003673C119
MNFFAVVELNDEGDTLEATEYGQAAIGRVLKAQDQFHLGIDVEDFDPCPRQRSSSTFAFTVPTPRRG